MTLLRGFASVSGLTFASRLLGLWRDVVIANVFGAGAVSDAFFAAFRLPNMLRRFTAEGALTQAFVPVYSRQLQQDTAAAALLAGDIMLLLLAFLLAVSALCIAFAPAVIFMLAPGLAESALAADLLRIVFPYIVFISLVALFAGMLNARARFSAAAAAPLLLNAAMIGSALWWAPLFAQPVFALAWGVFIGGAAQLLWLVWHLARAGLWPRLALRRPQAGAWQVLRLFWRSALGAGAAQFNLLINLFIASFLVSGSVSWLYFADRLMELPAGLLGAALAMVALPALSASADNPPRFHALLDNTLRLILLLALPAAAGLACLALPLVATLFMHGAFGAEDALMTKQAVLAYAIGVPGLVAVRPLAAAFFARQEAGVPVRAAAAALLITQGCNAVFVFGLGLAHAGLALSVGLAACANALILYFALRRRGWYVPRPRWIKFAAQVAVALAAMVAVLLWLLPPESFWLESAFGARLARLCLCLAAAIAVYFAVAYACGVRWRQFNQPLAAARE